MANYVYIATSLDGFIADKNNELDWLMEMPNPEGTDFGFAAFIGRMDAMVMGRNTFEKVLTFDEWPYPIKVFVLSNTLSEIPNDLKGKIEIINGEVKTIVAQLADQGYHNLYIDGGKVIQRFLAADLIDELIINRIPTILGEGIPLFGKLPTPLKFTNVKTKILTDQMVMSHYSK